MESVSHMQRQTKPHPLLFKTAADTAPSHSVSITFTVIFIPGIHTVLEPIADERVVDTHVAVAEERVAFTGS